MKNKFTIALAASAVALGAYMIFVEAKKDAPTDTQEVAVWSLTDNQAKDLNTLVVTSGGKEAKYVREGEMWRLASQPKRELDPGSWDVPYKNLKNLTASRKVEDKPGDLAKYGLAKPDTTVTWGEASSPYKLSVGDKNPAGDAYYVLTAKDGAVYTVSSWKVDDWKKWATNPPLSALPSPTPTPTPAPSAAASAAPGASPAASTAPASPAPSPAASK